jgi:nucleoside 2-deoxyribosyltransferase
LKVYLAGPMRDYPEFNFPAFSDGATKLRAFGFEVFSPAERDINQGFNPSGMKGNNAELGPAGFSLREALADDLGYVCREADAVVVLPGWEKSSGATAEAYAAKALGLPVMTLAEALGTEEPPRADILTEAKALITGNRNAQYGPPTQDFRRTAEMATAFGFRFVGHADGAPEDLEPHHVSIFMMLLKISRLAWSPNKRDSWVDIPGYAGCGWECAVEEAA